MRPHAGFHRRQPEKRVDDTAIGNDFFRLSTAHQPGSEFIEAIGFVLEQCGHRGNLPEGWRERFAERIDSCREPAQSTTVCRQTRASRKKPGGVTKKTQAAGDKTRSDFQFMKFGSQLSCAARSSARARLPEPSSATVFPPV